ncbi:MAG TPA: anaerobic ribonucleoside-triphosphate reductase activating protein [Casimicrobiaceae bacterium]
MARTERHGSPAGASRCLRIGGLTPLSTADYPGQLAAVVFCQGCPWRCGYCHNPHLLPARGAAEIAWDDVLAFLRRREGLLDAVVFSGGEPLAQRALAGAMRTVKKMGFKIGMHTGGAYPARLAQVLPLLDWVGFDVKAPFDAYVLITGAPESGSYAQACAKLVIESGVAHEFRTTVHPRQLSALAVRRLADDLAWHGVRHYALQEFRAEGCANAALVNDRSPSFLTEHFGAAIAPCFASFELRRASRRT